MAKYWRIIPGCVFPASAGINRQIALRVIASASVPRVSGDKPANTAFSGGGLECSPRQRG
ncbi:TPA: hypothetical protein JLS10_004829 [Escherichia coli]|nr:hypothetical protein [Escherichia coli]